MSEIKFSNPALAQESFNWEGHQDNVRFREEFVNDNTIKRYYEDGWILQYEIDQQGNSIPNSFQWVERK